MFNNFDEDATVNMDTATPRQRLSSTLSVPQNGPRPPQAAGAAAAGPATGPAAAPGAAAAGKRILRSFGSHHWKEKKNKIGKSI